MPTAWMVFGMIGASLFILIQLIMIVDFAHAWNESWLAAHEESDNKSWIYGWQHLAFRVHSDIPSDLHR